MPTPAQPDRLIMPYLLALVDCVRVQLAKCSAPVCRYDVLITDAEQLDGCDCCDEPGVDGRVWARVANTTPLGSTSPAACFSGLVDEVHLGISRCAVTGEELASSDAYRSQAHLGYADRSALLSAIRSCRETRRAKASIDGWVPLGPAGGCFGGYWTINVPVG